jgi:ABC-type transporter Mla subunit MlaD
MQHLYNSMEARDKASKTVEPLDKTAKEPTADTLEESTAATLEESIDKVVVAMNKIQQAVQDRREWLEQFRIRNTSAPEEEEMTENVELTTRDPVPSALRHEEKSTETIDLTPDGTLSARKYESKSTETIEPTPDDSTSKAAMSQTITSLIEKCEETRCLIETNHHLSVMRVSSAAVRAATLSHTQKNINENIASLYTLADSFKDVLGEMSASMASLNLCKEEPVDEAKMYEKEKEGVDNLLRELRSVAEQLKGADVKKEGVDRVDEVLQRR